MQCVLAVTKRSLGGLPSRASRVQLTQWLAFFVSGEPPMQNESHHRANSRCKIHHSHHAPCAYRCRIHHNHRELQWKQAGGRARCFTDEDIIQWALIRDEISNQIKSNQIKSNQIQSNPIQSSQVKSSQVKSNQIKSNSNPIQSNPIQSNPIKSNQIKSSKIESSQIQSNKIK